jgi:hypothetical protein
MAGLGPIALNHGLVLRRLVGSILENPELILRRPLDELKSVLRSPQ